MSASEAAQVAARFHDIIVLTSADRRGLSAQLAAATGAGIARLDGFYLIDPLGNFMMRYEMTAEPKGVLKDLQRLLKYSALGR